jgi:hypothetical protein
MDSNERGRAKKVKQRHHTDNAFRLDTPYLRMRPEILDASFHGAAPVRLWR